MCPLGSALAADGEVRGRCSRRQHSFRRGKYDYQAEMKVRIDTAFRSYQSVMVQMPTGTEKSKRFILSENVEEYDALYDLYYDGENPPIFKKRKKSYEL